MTVWKRRVARGRCGGCGARKPQGWKGSQCPECRDAMNARLNVLRQSRDEARKAAIAANQRRRRLAAEAAGICIDCPSPARRAHQRCMPCSLHLALKARLWREARKQTA